MEAAGVEIIHHLPGRLRLRVPEVKANGSYASSLETRLRTINGIRTAEANPVTGSVLIHYDHEHTVSVLRALKTIPAPNPKPRHVQRPAMTTRQSELASLIARAALQRAVETAVEIAVQKSILLLIAAIL
jgi:hypothetical protein